MEPSRIVAWGAELRRVHEQLADALVIARESIESGAAPIMTPIEPQTHCWAFCAALDGHHRGEDRALFPQILNRHPELAEVIGNLNRDHVMIGHLLGELRHSMAGGDPPEVLLRHLDGIEAVMTTHFRYEEKRLRGLIDALDLTGFDTAAVFGP